MNANGLEMSATPVQSPEGLCLRFVIVDSGAVVYEKVINPFDEDAIIGLSDEVVRQTGQPLTDVEQGVAELIGRERSNWLRQRQAVQTEQPSDETISPALPPYIAVDEQQAVEWGIPGSFGILRTDKRVFLCNFILTLDEDVTVEDDLEKQRFFMGRLRLPRREMPFRITARDYADNGKLKAEIFAAGGPEIQIHCSMEMLRTAVSELSKQGGITLRRRTTNFGWSEDGASYLVPSGRIGASGIVAAGEDVDLRIDLSDEEQARYLDLKPIDAERLKAVKRHVVEDLLALHDRTVTYSLLGTVAAAILRRFASGCGHFGLWLVGLTGAGKSFVAKLFLNFFGDYPVNSGRFATWSSTPNSLQRQGYFYKDAMYLIDDYKPEVVAPWQVVRVLQTYSDGTARGRLKSDATANVSRPIRGQLVCTGEDVPEHNASALARCVVVPVPNRPKDQTRGQRCVRQCQDYSGVTADFVRWIIAENRGIAFAIRVQELQERFYHEVAGQQNDSRVAANLALLGAAFEQFAEYLGDVWPNWREEARRFVDEDLVAMRGSMLDEVREQQASSVFLETLAELVRFGRVKVEGYANTAAEHKDVIGRLADGCFEFSTKLALEAVNRSLQAQGKESVKTTERGLLRQLCDDGKLLGSDGNALVPGVEEDLTRRTRLQGKQTRSFRIDMLVLLGNEAVVSPRLATLLRPSLGADIA